MLSLRLDNPDRPYNLALILLDLRLFGSAGQECLDPRPFSVRCQRHVIRTMAGHDFSLTMELDRNGILVVRMSGEFDFLYWRDKRRDFLQGALAGVELEGRGNIVDLSDFIPPPEKWISVISRILEELRQEGQPTGPVAYVIGRSISNELTIEFFECLNELGSPDRGTYRTFTDYQHAYDWLLEEVRETRRTTP